jgi:hypothetical protein
VSARVAALPLARRRARTRIDADPVGETLTFASPGGPLVAVCGLHGGAGTTTLACLLASHAAAASPSGRVLAVEADARAGELAARLGVASALALPELAAARACEQLPEQGAVAQRTDGLRVLAADGPRGAAAPATALAAVLAEARVAHGLCVLDAGSLRGPSAETALAGADVVLWVADPARLDHAALASPLVRPARGARWALALVPVSGAGQAPRRELRRLRADLTAVIAVPRGAHTDPALGRRVAERLGRGLLG